MNLAGILTAIEELKAQHFRDYDCEISEAELLVALSELLDEHRKKEIKRKFVAFGPEYLVAAIKHIRAGGSGKGPRTDCERSEHGNKESGKLADPGSQPPSPGGPKLVKAASRAGKSL